MMKRSPIKKLFLQISQYPQKNTFVGVLKLYYKEGPNMCFLVNIAKFLRTPVFKNICERLFQRFATRANNITSNIGSEEDIVSKKNQKKSKTKRPF